MSHYQYSAANYNGMDYLNSGSYPNECCGARIHGNFYEFVTFTKGINYFAIDKNHDQKAWDINELEKDLPGALFYKLDMGHFYLYISIVKDINQKYIFHGDDRILYPKYNPVYTAPVERGLFHTYINGQLFQVLQHSTYYGLRDYGMQTFPQILEKLDFQKNANYTQKQIQDMVLKAYPTNIPDMRMVLIRILLSYQNFCQILQKKIPITFIYTDNQKEYFDAMFKDYPGLNDYDYFTFEKSYNTNYPSSGKRLNLVVGKVDHA